MGSCSTMEWQTTYRFSLFEGRAPSLLNLFARTLLPTAFLGFLGLGLIGKCLLLGRQGSTLALGLLTRLTTWCSSHEP